MEFIKSMVDMKYTVLMAVYKKEKAEYLNLAIKSMLEQTVTPDEFIIVEDGILTKDLYKVIGYYKKSFPNLFKIISLKKNKGLGPALAIGIQNSKNELIARMDSDDFSVNTRCEKQLSKFKENPDLGIVGTYEVEFIGNINNEISVHRVPEKYEEINKFMRRRCALLHPTVMYKKSIVQSCGNYHSVYLYEDYDLFSRMVFENNIKSYNIQEKLYYIRISEDFFKRRGGTNYLKTVVKFKWNQYRKGYMSITDFLISGAGQACICLLPNKLRKIFYLKFLRK